MSAPLRLNGADLVCDLSGALFWPDQETLVVADLHLEKGSAFAERGQLLPPYDSAATLAALARAVETYCPRRVICLGDSFHDQGAAERLDEADCRRLQDLTRDRAWIWITGNHDPAPPEDWGGQSLAEVTISCLIFRHEALPGGVGEVSGHFHPKASVRVRNKRLTTRCFASDGRRLVLPAFGAFTGGLNVLDPAIAGLFPHGFQVRMLGRERIFAYASKELVGPPTGSLPDILWQATS